MLRKGNDHICKGFGCSVCQMLDQTTSINLDTVAGPAEIEQMALYDSVTGLLNVRAFQKKLKYELKRSRRYKRPLALSMIGIDGFNLLQSDYGEFACNEALKKLGQILLETVRDVDIAARYSSAWFAVLFPETNATGASIITERIRAKIETCSVSAEWRNFRFSASIGISSFPAQARDGDALFGQCVQALELAISRGGNRICVV
jgi:diguanylate cyclase (GGDEF)-like protein